jgi:large subunit ribosomal protein L5
MQKLGYKTVMQVPRLRKITINMGVGETTTDKKILDHAVADMTKIAGQKPVVTKARKSIANFKVRANFPVGCMVTLRGARMYEFFDRPGEHRDAAHPRLPRRVQPLVRRPRQLQPRLQGADHFPEIEYDKIDTLRGMNIAITTTAKTDDEARSLLAAFRFPFKH